MKKAAWILLIMFGVGSFPVTSDSGPKRNRKQWIKRNPNRVVVVADKQTQYRDVPAAVNAYFACFDINTVTAPPDVLPYEHEPWTGFVVVQGQKFDCAQQYGSSTAKSSLGTTASLATMTSLGTIGPGETKTVTLQIPIEASPASDASPPRVTRGNVSVQILGDAESSVPVIVFSEQSVGDVAIVTVFYRETAQIGSEAIELMRSKTAVVPVLPGVAVASDNVAVPRSRITRINIQLATHGESQRFDLP